MDDYNIDLLKAKDIDEFKKLSERYCSDVFSVAYCLLLSPAQAHLICENAFLKAYEKIEEYDEKIGIANWLCKIAYEEALTYSKRINDPTVRFAEKSTSVSSDAAKDKVLDIENDVKLALSILPFDQREAILLHDGYGFGYDRLAYIMGLSPGIIRSRTGLARSGLKSILFKKWNV